MSKDNSADKTSIKTKILTSFFNSAIAKMKSYGGSMQYSEEEIKKFADIIKGSIQRKVGVEQIKDELSNLACIFESKSSGEFIKTMDGFLDSQSYEVVLSAIGESSDQS